MSSEDTIWSGRPSQIINLRFYILCFLGSPLIFPIGLAIWRYINTHYVQYEVSSERIFVYSGIFTRDTEEVELYRVKDYTIHQPFFLRLFDLYVVTINTSDNTLPFLLLNAIPQGDEVRNLIRQRVEKLRQEKNIREVDFNGG